ncbi:polysaccharide deacetylase family protein [Anaerolentibacter hominis]|uniref:polysaccharide deacetylase family protein n=1 Tax=Anaerolentibacter hominis TaxID=3079009 RepID=UPI0031B808A3
MERDWRVKQRKRKTRKKVFRFMISMMFLICIVWGIMLINRLSGESEKLLDKQELAKARLEELETENSELESKKNSLIKEKDQMQQQADSQAEYIGELEDTVMSMTEETSAAGGELTYDPGIYEGLYPELRAGEETTAEKKAYLTFNGAPCGQMENILGILEQYDIPATFFVDDTDNPEYTALYEQIAGQGHILALRGAGTPEETLYQSLDNYMEDFNKIYEKVYALTGIRCSLFRFPGGSKSTTSVYQNIKQELGRRGFLYFDWNISAGDESGNAAAGVISERVLSQADRVNNAVILLHGGERNQTTAEALPSIIEGLTARGFTFESLNKEVKPVQFSSDSADRSSNQNNTQ